MSVGECPGKFVDHLALFAQASANVIWRDLFALPCSAYVLLHMDDSGSHHRRSRTTALAFCALEDAIAQAHSGPVERTYGCRLALALLVERGIAPPEQASYFWRGISSPALRTGHIHDASLRTTPMEGLLRQWYGRCGLPEPVYIKRMHWARRYAPDLDLDGTTPELGCMCNRYQRGENQHILKLFDASLIRSLNNGPLTVHPKDPGFVIRVKEGALVLDQMTWGFPVVLRGKQGQLLKPKPVNNARFDKLGGFWKRWAVQPANRCLIPTARFAEAVGTPGRMTTTWLSVPEQPIFAWAGLWSESEEWGAVYTGVMTDNAPELAAIHDRSPVILDPADWSTWLTAPLPELYQYDRPYPASRMKVEATNDLWAQRG